MNHLLKQSSVGLAVTLTSWLASAPAAQQAPTIAPHKVKPVEQLHVSPVQASWNDLLPLDAVNRTIPSELLVSNVGPFEIPPVEIGPSGKLLSAPTGEVYAASGPCATPFLAEPTSVTNFNAQLDDGTTTGFSYAPNVSGGVGPNHLFTLSDTQAVVQGRDGSAISSMTAATFWTPVFAGPLLYSRVNYDNMADRWIATARSGVGTPTYTMRLLLAVSVTDDPTGAWNYYSIHPDVSLVTFPDWTPHGYNANWITISANEFNVTGGAFVGPKMWVCDKAAAMAGGTMTVSVFGPGWTTTVHGSGGSSPMPTRDMDGSSANMYLLNDSFTSSGIFLLQISVLSGGPTTPVVSAIPGSPFGGTTSFHFVSVNFSSTQLTMAQLAPETRTISPFSIRLASALVRNGKVWASHTGGNLPTPVNETRVSWYQLDPTLPFAGSSLPAPNGMILQNAQIGAGAGNAQIVPSLAVNCAEDAIIGFSSGNSTKFPEASYVFRRGADAISTTGPIRLLKAGESNYWKTLAGTTAPWGLASSSAVDPRDDSSLWTLQQYAGTRVTPLPGPDTDSRWGTQWGRLGFTGTITDQPDSLVICQGATAVFQVVASTSNGPLTYQWRKNAVELSGETADTLTLATTVLGDVGSYDCVVYDANGGEVSGSATLGFSEPSITTQPTGVTVAVGGPASFSVVASGLGTLTYQWQLDGNPILGATSDTYSIGATVKADYGSYTCVVSDDCGFVESAAADLKLPTKGNNVSLGALSFQILTQPVSQVGCLNESVTFTVVAAGNNVTYQWRKNFVDIGGETGSSLTLNSLTAGDSAFYDVRLTSGSQNKTSFPAFLTLTDDPVITLQPTPSNQTVSAGASVSYTVAATGLNLTYQWRFRSTVPFSPFVDLVGQNSPTLYLDPVTGDNSGSYRCVVRNLCGSVTSNTVQLLVF